MNIRAPGRACLLRLSLSVLVFGSLLVPGGAKAGSGGPIPPPMFWQDFFKLGTFTSDGVTAVVITIPVDADNETIIDDPTGGGGPKQDQPIAPSIKGPGVLIYPAGTTPPFANSVPPLHVNAAGYVTSDNTSADWHPAISAAVAGPYWPSEWAKKVFGGPLDNPIGHVTVAVLPAGDYDAWAQFGSGSIGATLGPTDRWPYYFLTSAVTFTGNVPPANNTLPTVYVLATKANATKGAGDNLKFTFQRVSQSGDNSKALVVNFSVTGTAPSSDYTPDKSTPITIPAGSDTVVLKASPVANGVYDPGVTVVVTVLPDSANPITYKHDTSPAVGTIQSIDQAPTIQWTTGGLSQYGNDPHYQSVSITPGQTISIQSLATDADNNLAAIYVDAGQDTPPASGNAWNYSPVSGGSGTAAQNFTGGAPGDQWFSVRSMDTVGVYSDTYYLRVHVDAPPQVAWEGLAGYGQNANATIYVGQSVNVQALYNDADGLGDAQLLYTWASATAPGSFTGDDGPRPAGTGTYRRYWNSSASPTFAPTAPGTYVFYAAVSDGMIQPATIALTVTVPNRPPTVAWSVPGAYQVNGNTWEVDLQGASAPEVIAATGVDPDNRMGAVLINRGTGDPSQNQGTPFAQTPGGYAAGTMTGDEMRPPLMTSLDSAAFEQANQDNYSWFSAAATDQDGAVSAPIHLLVRVFNQPPTNAVWTSPGGLTPINATDAKKTVYANSLAVALTATSSDPEQKMWVALINNIYNTPRAGNPAGNEVGVGFSTDGVNATAGFTPGAETFDVVGDHWFSAIGIDDGMDYSGGAVPSAAHLDVSVVNRLPSASFASKPNGVNVNQPVTIQGVGTDPDKAMQRVQLQIVSAPANSGYNAGQAFGDTSVPAAQQVYPSNVPTWETDAAVTPSYSGNYTVRALVWDRHGGTAQQDMTFNVANRPPVFAWTQASVHVLAGDTVQLPYTVMDPDANLGIATASGPNGYTMQASYPNAGNASGSFPFLSPTPGIYTVTGAAFDRENLESVATPSITVVVEPIDTAPLAKFTSPAPGGTSLSVTHFVDDVVSVGASATDVDGNLSTLQIALGSASWAQSPASGNVSTLAAAGSFTVPVLGAETSHTYTFGATATDSGTIPGGLIPQAPKSSTTATLQIVVPNRAPTIQWTAPAGGVGLTAANPYVGYLLQPLKITAHGNDRDGNLSAESIIQQGIANAVLYDASSPDGRNGDVAYSFTPTVPGMYVFAAQAYDKAGVASGPVNLYIQVQDYPSDSTGTIGALIVSPATTISQVFAPGSLPIVVKGGVAALGRSKGRLGVVAASTGVGATQIIPVPNYLNGTQIPPLAPPILDLRTETVAPVVDHSDPSTSTN